MKKIAFASLAALMLLDAPAFAEPVTYVIEPTHSYPRFEYSHLGFSNQVQRFNKTSGTIVLDRAARNASVDISIDARSVDTGYSLFNEHLQGEDFLDTARYPTI
ncbi:MAG TPA: YceI family protein, partial [Accumulibacter sp.]|nr:YceI family protein [Accumulibacter sp.]